MKRALICKHWKPSKNSDGSFKCKKMGTVICSGDESSVQIHPGLYASYECWEKGTKKCQ